MCLLIQMLISFFSQVMIWDDDQGRCIAELSFRSQVTVDSAYGLFSNMERFVMSTLLFK